MAEYDLIVRNAKIVTAERQTEGDIAVKDGQVVEIGPDLKGKGTREIDAGGKFVHLSDGGHFENLGLYELVRRRCRFIQRGSCLIASSAASWPCSSSVIRVSKRLRQP